MKHREAISRIKEHMHIHFKNEESRAIYITEALDLAMEALEKQIPKKLVIGEELYHCPGCGEKDAILQGDNYCFNCGQALDWSDENEQSGNIGHDV